MVDGVATAIGTGVDWLVVTAIEELAAVLDGVAVVVDAGVGDSVATTGGVGFG
jgi:thiazole synthase ThiGH ThiG subunit